MDEILNLIESVSEGFPSYFFILFQGYGFKKSDDLVTCLIIRIMQFEIIIPLLYYCFDSMKDKESQRTKKKK